MQAWAIAVIVIASVFVALFFIYALVYPRLRPKRVLHTGLEFVSEYHLPGYRYCGPGTHYQTRLDRKQEPINAVDRCCQAHDAVYNAPTSATVQQADQDLIACIERAPISSPEEAEVGRQVIGFMRGKRIMEQLRVIPPGAHRSV